MLITIAIVKLIQLIVLNWSETLNLVTNASIYTGAITLIITIAGVIIMKKNYSIYGLVKDSNPELAEDMKEHSYFPDSGKYTFRKIGKTMTQISAALFFLNSFALFNLFGLLILWLVIVGAVVLLSLLILFIINNDKIINGPEIAVILTLIFIIGFTYYLDIFIFSWDRPWISGVAAILIALLIVFMKIRSRIREHKEKLEQAEYDAKTAADEMVKMKNRLEAKSKLEMRLASLPFYDLVIYYFNEKKENELIYWDEVVNIYFEAMRNLIEDTSRKLEASAEQKVQIAWLLSQKKAEKSSKFYKLIATTFEASDCEAVLFSNVDGATVKVYPEAFAQCTLKKEVITNFLSQEFDDKYKKLLYNKVKRVFAHNEFYGLINALIYSYEKTWDEELSAKLLDRINEIFTFANDCLNSMWQKGNRTSLRKHLDAIYTYCVLNGIHTQLPTIKQEPIEDIRIEL